jgi:hypothetical protein
MKINELLEAAITPKDEVNKIRAEFQSLLDKAGVMADLLDVSYNHPNKPKSIAIFSIVIPKIEKNGKYDADEAEITLRLAHRLISKWLAQKEADGQLVYVGRLSKVGDGRKFSTGPYNVWKNNIRLEVPGFIVEAYIANKEDAGVTKNEAWINPGGLPV